MEAVEAPKNLGICQTLIASRFGIANAMLG